MTRWSSSMEEPGTIAPGARLRSGKVIFLDRDGVVILDRNYLSDPADVQLVPGAAKAMAMARDAGFLLVGLSNQSGIGRGYFGETDLDSVMERLTELLRVEGVSFDAFFYCPHAPDDGCRCRKPLTGLLDEAAELFSWRPEESWLIGDKFSDIELALAASLNPVLVRTGYGSDQQDRLKPSQEVLVVDDLPAAVKRILNGAVP